MGSSESNRHPKQMVPMIIEYKCPFCGGSFQKEELHKHIVDEIKVFKCPFCNEKFNNIKVYKTHIGEEALKEEEKEEKKEYKDLSKINVCMGYFEERKFLTEFKNQRLINQLSNIKKNMKELGNIDEVNTLIQADEEIEPSQKVNEFCNDCYLWINFKILGSLFVIFYLVAIYQLIGLLSATEEEIMFGIKSILFEKNRTNITQIIEENYENYSFKNIPSFDIELFFLTSIIGKIFLKNCGFIKSSIFFIVINSLFIFFLRSFTFPENRYNIYQLLLLLLYYILIYISVGCISLYPHQIFFEGLKKYYNYRDEKKKEKSYSFFPYLCWTVILSYIIHFKLNIYFEKHKYFNDFFIIKILIYSILVFASILIYCFYCGAFNNWIFRSKFNNNSERTIWKICGYLIYWEKNFHENNKVCCRSCRIVFRKCNYLAYEDPITVFCPCFRLHCCAFNDCCCDGDSTLAELYQENESLCYCYKVQRKLSWFTDLLFKNDIFALTCIDIILEIMVIGFQRKINEKLYSNTNNQNIIVISIFLSSFIIFSLFNNNQLVLSLFFSFWNCILGSKKRNPIGDKILKLIGISIWNFLLVIIFSGFSFFGNKRLKEFTDNYLIIIPFTLSKFYYYVLMNNLVVVIDNNNIDLLSNSTVVSIFLTIYNILVAIIIKILDFNVEFLILIQFIFSLAIIIPFIILSLCLLDKSM